MTPDQLRTALRDLNAQRTVQFAFAHMGSTDAFYLRVTNAMLVPAEADQLIKLTDGKKEYIIDAERVAWIEIG